jgi:hypothetical protein
MIDGMSFLNETPEGVSSLMADEHLDVEMETIEGRLYGFAKRGGFSFVVGEDGRIRTVHLYSEGHQDYGQFQGALPEGVRFDSSRAAIRESLGAPTVSREPGVTPSGRFATAWDRFDGPDVKVHIEYSSDEQSIQLVTLMKSTVDPGMLA